MIRCCIIFLFAGSVLPEFKRQLCCMRKLHAVNKRKVQFFSHCIRTRRNKLRKKQFGTLPYVIVSLFPFSLCIYSLLCCIVGPFYVPWTMSVVILYVCVSERKRSAVSKKLDQINTNLFYNKIMQLKEKLPCTQHFLRGFELRRIHRTVGLYCNCSVFIKWPQYCTINLFYLDSNVGKWHQRTNWSVAGHVRDHICGNSLLRRQST